jgi:hypothetical protein
MTNRFKLPETDEPEFSEEAEIKIKRSSETENLFFKKLFSEGVVSKEAATQMLPFLIFLSVICMIYIANSHIALNNIRKIDQLNKEVKELSWEYKSLKADLMFKSKLTEVAKQVDTLGLKELTEPPKKIVVRSN